MKILFLSDNFPPEVNAPASRTFDHCREWVKSGDEVTVITCAPNFPQGKLYAGYHNKLWQEEIIEGIRVIRVWSYIVANKGFFKRTLDFISFSVSSFLAGLFVKTDVIIATSPQFFTALSGRTLSFWKRKPWIMEVRDLWPESIKTVGALNISPFIRYFEWEEKKCYRSARSIIVVTDSFKRKLNERGIDDTKVYVVKNGVDRNLFVPVEEKDAELLTRLDLKNKKIIGYIGTHGMAHKLDFILRCASILQNKAPEYHFLFLGNGAEKDNLKKLIDIVLNGLERKEFFIPFTEEEINMMFDSSIAITYGAYDNNKLVGTAQLYLNENYVNEIKEILELKNNKIAELGGALVLKEYRNKGIIKNLLSILIKEAENKNYDYLVATVHPENIASNKAVLSTNRHLAKLNI